MEKFLTKHAFLISIFQDYWSIAKYFNRISHLSPLIPKINSERNRVLIQLSKLRYVDHFIAAFLPFRVLIKISTPNSLSITLAIAYVISHKKIRINMIITSE
jgi:hypothetical protein